MRESDGKDRGAIDLNKRMEEIAPVLRTLPKGTHVAFFQEGDDLYLYNISRALEFVARRPATTSINVAEHATQIQPRDEGLPPENKILIDADHAATVDLSCPVMLLEGRSDLDGAQGTVIDGWHRIYRAARLGIEQLPAVVITAEEEPLIRIEPGLTRS